MGPLLFAVQTYRGTGRSQVGTHAHTLTRQCRTESSRQTRKSFHSLSHTLRQS